MRPGVPRSPVGRGVLALALAVAGLGLLELAHPDPAAALSCGPDGYRAAGTNEIQPTTDGVTAKIEFVNEALCTTGANFSAYWVGIVKASQGKNNIFQIGVDKCRLTDCDPDESPQNAPYYFWAYGHDQSAACGMAAAPTPHSIPGTPTSGLTLYSIYRTTIPGLGTTYVAKKAGATIVQIPQSSIEGCWGGISGSQIVNEIDNANTQGGGPDSNRQNFESAQWHSSTGWHTISRPPGSHCDFEQNLPSQLCQWKADGSNIWYSWDTRWP